MANFQHYLIERIGNGQFHYYDDFNEFKQSNGYLLSFSGKVFEYKLILHVKLRTYYRIIN